MMTEIPGTDLTTEAARNRASRMLNEHDALILVALADAYDNAVADAYDHTVATAVTRRVTLEVALTTAKDIADRDKYSPQESAAAWDVVDALQTILTAPTTPDRDTTGDDHDGKQITRAEEFTPGETDDDA